MLNKHISAVLLDIIQPVPLKSYAAKRNFVIYEGALFSKERCAVEDKKIVELYWARDESALDETRDKYGKYLVKIAHNILSDPEDCREVVNGTYLKAWRSMPSNKPDVLSTYLGRITRRLSIDVFRKKDASKRKGLEYALSLSELEDCIAGGTKPEREAELELLAAAISAYLRALSKYARDIFMCRYFYMDSIAEIAKYAHSSESKVKSLLYRTRLGLKKHLEKEGIL